MNPKGALHGAVGSSSCPICETSSRSDDHGVIFIWPPEGHLFGKIKTLLRGMADTLDIRPQENCIIVKDIDNGHLLDELEAALSSIEAADTRILLSNTTEPSLGDFGNVQTLEAAMRSRRGIWLVDLLDAENYTSYAQPIVSVLDERPVFGNEYLFRGHDGAGNVISPDTLFDAAQDPRVFFNLDRTARISAVNAAARMTGDSRIFINFMPGAIYDPAVCLRTTIKAIEQHGVSPDRIVFEIVESQRIDDINHLASIVKYYRDAGYRVALDDFGAGHSNLEVFIALRPDFVKLDKSLTQNLSPEDNRVTMVKSVVRTFHSAGIDVIAEGIETEQNAITVTDCGVDYMQGYHFGKPAPVI